MTVYQQALVDLQTVRDFLRFGESILRKQEVVCGHGYLEPWDEVVALVLHALHLPGDCDPRILDSRLVAEEKETICSLLQRRADDRIPTAYLIHEAWFADLPFWVDERVLIPRSPLAECIEAQFQPWLSADKSTLRILDLCTGSGCIAIASAVHLPNATVVATDISHDALAVAKRNCDRHGVTDCVQLIQSDLWDAIPRHAFDLIVSNPPYVAPDEYAFLPREYQHEPSLGLEAGDQGLAIIARILEQANEFLKPDGVLIVEVGSAAQALVERFPHLPFCWLTFNRGGDGVFLLRHADLGGQYGG